MLSDCSGRSDVCGRWATESLKKEKIERKDSEEEEVKEFLGYFSILSLRLLLLLVGRARALYMNVLKL